MWFSDWASLGQIALKSVIGFAVLVALLRLAGKRSVATLNAFDLVVVFTVGSILSTMIMDPKTSMAGAILALALLIGLQWTTAFLVTRWIPFRKLMKSEPTLLVYGGQLLEQNMRRQRISEVEVYAAMRQQGVHDLEQVHAIVLETQGVISVLRQGEGELAASLQVSGVDIPETQR